MHDPDALTDDAAALEGSLADLGRRIDEAKADADRRAAAPPRPFPVLWVVAIVLLVALVGGVLVLAGTGDDGEDTAAGAGAQPTVTSPAADGGADTTVAPETTVAPVPETTVAPATTVAPGAAPATTAAPSAPATPATTVAAPPVTGAASQPRDKKL